VPRVDPAHERWNDGKCGAVEIRDEKVLSPTNGLYDVSQQSINGSGMAFPDHQLEIVVGAVAIVFLLIIGLILYFMGFEEVSIAINQGFTK